MENELLRPFVERAARELRGPSLREFLAVPVTGWAPVEEIASSGGPEKPTTPTSGS